MPRSFADKLNQLFDTVRRENGSPYSLSDVSGAVNQEGRTKLSPSYLSELRTGRKDNPNVWVADALARFFGQPLEYFVDDDMAPVLRTGRPPAATTLPTADLATFAGRLRSLVLSTQPTGGREPESRQLAAALQREGHSVSADVLDAVRTGEGDPSADLVVALADHFGVPAVYLTDREVAESIGPDLRLLRAMRDDNVRALALRARRLSPGDRDRVVDLVNRLSSETGTPPDQLDY